MTRTTSREFENLGRETSLATVMYHHTVGAAVGLSVVELQCIDLLGRDGPQTAGAIVRHTGLTSGSVTGLITRLRDRGLVTREVDPTDRRRVLVSLVPGPALERITVLYAPIDIAFQRLVHSYAPDERELLRGFIEQMIALLHEQIDEILGL
ncbi:MarR family winged helix-turn-helix transcriptional regulator [Microlunatus endophyticus]|nr:MarR family transcriptional regulator [Microlunatus endophyticus]